MATKSSGKTGKKKPIADVSKPGDTAPSSTSKSVIITNRPLLKDPMVVESDENDEKTDPGPLAGTAKLKSDTAKPASEKKSAKDPSIAELAAAAAAEHPAKSEESVKPPESEPKPEPESAQPEEKPEEKPAEPEPEKTEEPDESSPDQEAKKPGTKELDAAAAEQAKRDAEVQKLVESKKYYLSINSVEKRRSKRFVALGILLSVLLILAWADIALDAGLVQMNGIKPVTHFFSN